MGKTIMSFVLGVIGGVSGLFLAQSISEDAEKPEKTGAVTPADRPVGGKQEEKLLKKVKRLEKENRDLELQLADAGVPSSSKPGREITQSPSENPEEKKEGKNALVDLMMAFGGEAAKRQANVQIKQLTDRLGLNEIQQDNARAALLKVLEARQAAGAKMLKGQATFADLAAADEDNYHAFDTAMAEILQDSQKDEYAAYQEEREVNRIEKKVNEDLDGLSGISDLTDDQRDQAREVFFELNAAEPPGSIPEGTTMAQFNDFIDDAIGKRVDGLTPILTESQMGAYQERAAGFRELITNLVSAGTGNSAPANPE